MSKHDKTYIEIIDDFGNKTKYKGLTPKQARDKLDEYIRDCGEGR